LHPPIQKLLHAVGVLCIDYYEACQRKNRSTAVQTVRWNDCHSRVEASRQQAQKKICLDFVHALLELAAWLQAGEDRAIAAGGKADLKLKKRLRPLAEALALPLVLFAKLDCGRETSNTRASHIAHSSQKAKLY
jgi:hypothetical protein